MNVRTNSEGLIRCESGMQAISSISIIAIACTLLVALARISATSVNQIQSIDLIDSSVGDTFQGFTPQATSGGNQRQSEKRELDRNPIADRVRENRNQSTGTPNTRPSSTSRPSSINRPGSTPSSRRVGGGSVNTQKPGRAVDSNLAAAIDVDAPKMEISESGRYLRKGQARITAGREKMEKIQQKYDALELNQATPMNPETRTWIESDLAKALRANHPSLSEEQVKTEVGKRVAFIEKRFPPEWHGVASQMFGRINNVDEMKNKVMGISAGENGKAIVSYPETDQNGEQVFKIQQMDVITGKYGYVGRDEQDKKNSGKTPVDRLMIANGGKITPQGKFSSRNRSKTVLNSAIYFEDSDGGLQGTRGTHWHGTYPGRARGYNQKSSLGCIVAPKPYEMDVVAMKTFEHGGVFYNVKENPELPFNAKGAKINKSKSR